MRRCRRPYHLLEKTTWVFLEGFPLKAMSQQASWWAPCQTMRVFLIWRKDVRRIQEELKLLQAHTRPWGCPSYALAPDLAKFLQGFYSEQFIVNPVLPATLDPTLQCDSYHNWCIQNCLFLQNKPNMQAFGNIPTKNRQHWTELRLIHYPICSTRWIFGGI